MSNGRSLVRLALGGAALALVASSARADELAPDVASTLELTTLVTGLELPTAIEPLPDGRMVIAEKGGRVLLR